MFQVARTIGFPAENQNVQKEKQMSFLAEEECDSILLNAQEQKSSWESLRKNYRIFLEKKNLNF